MSFAPALPEHILQVGCVLFGLTPQGISYPRRKSQHFIGAKFGELQLQKTCISSPSNLSMSLLKMSKKSPSSQTHFCNFFEHSNHTSCAAGQFQRTWPVVSSACSQIGQRKSEVMCLLCKFPLVGRILWQAFHMNICTILGTFKLHTILYSSAEFPIEEHDPFSISNRVFAKW